MGLYLRKAFQFGPLRLNLSKGGLGISAGLKGLRIGTGPRGTYLHAGRGGLYVRESLGPPARKPEHPAPRLVPGPPSQPTQASVPTSSGIAIKAGPSPHAVRVQAKRYGSAVFVPPIFGGVFALLALAAKVAILAGFIAILSAAAVVLILVADANYARRLSGYTSRLLALLKLKPPLPSGPVQSILQLRQAGNFRPEHLHAIHYAAFRALLEAIMQDGVITEPERQVIAQATGLLGLPPQDLQSAKLEAFQRHYLTAISDHELTAEEDARLQGFQAALEIPPAAIQEELAMIADLREARQIRDGELHQIPVDIALQDKEICYHRTTAQLLEKRVLRSYTVNRVRQKEEGLVATKAGALYVTSKRLLLLADGVTSYPLRKVLDVDMDPEANQITITQDGRQRPIYLVVPDPIVTGAMIERAARDA